MGGEASKSLGEEPPAPGEPQDRSTEDEKIPQELLEDIKKDLAERLDIGVEKIELVESESVTWRDGSLGCPKPGEHYTQALVEGFRIVLEADEKRYDYRASTRGFFKLCDSEEASWRY